MFYLYQHHDMARLAELQAVLLARRERAHGLEADTILVPNHGLGRWLQTRLAESEGIAANLQLPLPARFIWELLPRLDPSAANNREFERARMRWHLYALLPELAGQLPGVAAYLRTEPREIQRLQLADRLADVFDQYLVFRPRMLDGWLAGTVHEAAPADWQARVWQALCRRLGEQHRGRRLEALIRRPPTREQLQRAGAPDALYCFGLGALPPDYLRFLYALARHIDVHFLLPNPGAGYWGDIRGQSLQAPAEELPQDATLERDQPLLASLGRGTRELLRVLYADELRDILEPELGEALDPEPPGEHSLLARVQSDIIELQARRESGSIAADVSVQVHACHGPLREVQVLQDQLLDLLGRDPTLQPRDIIVMMPEVSRYAAAIEGVFGAAQGAQRLPFSLSDRSRDGQHPLLQSFRQLLDLPLSRWSAGEVMRLAAVPAVMRRFCLDAPAVDQAREWIAHAGVRWGLDGETRRAFAAGDSAEYSWTFGLDRLLLGAVQSDEDVLIDEVAAWAELEGSATLELGRLWHLVQRLRHWADALARPAAADAWQQRLNALLDDLFEAGGGEPAELRALDELRASLDELAAAGQCLGDTSLSWEAVREVLGEALAASGERQPFLSGGISFCGMVPLRAVPFRVVCILGLDDGAFPRQERHPGFNVLRQHPRLGDHNVRDDDRLLFLQALMAAGDVFYLSYTGQDLNSGEMLPPSPLLGEWLDFLHRHHFRELTRKAFEATLISRQPMHPFSPRLFRPDQPRVFSYAAQWLTTPDAGRHEPPGFADAARLPAPAPAPIELDALRRFFNSPPRTFLREGLRMDLQAAAEELADAEPLQLDGLARYQLREALLDWACRHDTELPAQPDALWRRRALLPPVPLDAEAYAEAADQVNALLPVWRAWRRETEPEWQTLELDLDAGTLRGRIDGLWPDGPRRLRVGSLHAQHKLGAWIELLAACAAGCGGRLELAGVNAKGLDRVVLQIARPQATAALNALLQLYLEGMQTPLLFLPSLAARYCQARAQRGDEAAALATVNDYLSNDWQPAFERDDAGLRLLLQPGAPLGAQPGETAFCELAETIFGPLQQALEAGA